MKNADSPALPTTLPSPSQLFYSTVKCCGRTDLVAGRVNHNLISVRTRFRLRRPKRRGNDRFRDKFAFEQRAFLNHHVHGDYVRRSDEPVNFSRTKKHSIS